jgi:hypothetical protein
MPYSIVGIEERSGVGCVGGFGREDPFRMGGMGGGGLLENISILCESRPSVPRPHDRIMLIKKIQTVFLPLLFGEIHNSIHRYWWVSYDVFFVDFMVM